MLYLLLTSSAATASRYGATRSGKPIAFVIGGAFMTQRGLLALAAVYFCFLVGATLQLRATQAVSNMSLTYLITLGLEAALSLGVGLVLLGDRYSQVQVWGIALVIAGIALLRR